MKKHLLTGLVLMGLVVGAVPFLIPSTPEAQTALSTTTLDGAVTSATATTLIVDSSTNISAGHVGFVDRELVLFRSQVGSTNTWNVTRGFDGSVATTHADDAVIHVGVRERFYRDDPSGTCTRTSEVFLPRINASSGRIYDCLSGVWTVIRGSRYQKTVQFQQGGVAANAVDTIFFVADRPYTVTRVDAVWGVAEVTGAMDIMVEKLTGTTACASGTDLLSAAIAGTGTANTVNNGALVTTNASLALDTGNRLCVDLTATPNEVSQMTVTVTLDAP